MTVKLEVLRAVLPWVVGAVIPLFFLLIYLASTYQRLALSLSRCRQTWEALLAQLRRRQGTVSGQLDEPRWAARLGDEVSALRSAMARVERLLAEESRQPGDWARWVARVAVAKQEMDAALRNFGDGAHGTRFSGEFAETEAALSAAIGDYNQAVSRHLFVRRNILAVGLAAAFRLARPEIFSSVSVMAREPARPLGR